MKVCIAFSFNKDGTTGMNNAIVCNKPEVPSESELRKIRDQIKNFGKYDEVIILNYIPLRED